MSSSRNVESIIEDYNLHHVTYQNLAKSIKTILETLLKENNFFYQDTFHRLKSKASLTRKLNDHKFKKLSDIQDIAACRVIFYLESDITRFAELIYSEFGRENIIKFELKYSEDNYNASHIVVRMDKKRLGLSEYSKFKNLTCEIQLTTVLFHAWSEMAHDTIYKPSNDLESFDETQLSSLKSEFADIMKNHIKPASYSFEFIYTKLEDLKKGKEIFSLDFFNSITTLTSNNELHERMKLLSNYVSKFGDKAPKELGILQLITAVLEKSAKLKTESERTIWGTWEGMGYSDVATQCINILEELRYVYPLEIFHTLVTLSSSENNIVSERALKAVKSQSKYTLQVLRNEGYYSQKLILDEVKKWDKDKLKGNIPLLCTILDEILDCSFEGSEMKDYKTFSWQSGSLNASEELEKIRETALELLKEVYALCSTITQKAKVINVFNQATQPPRQGEYTQETIDMIVKSTNEVISFYISIIKNADNRVIKDIDEHSQWFKERFKADSIKELTELERLLEENKSYQIYRVFVGHEFRYKSIDNWQEAEIVRSQKLEEYISNYSVETYEKWEKIILEISEDVKGVNDIGEYQNFFKFLSEISKKQPKLAIDLVNKHESELSEVILHIFSGLWESEMRTEFTEMIKTWLEKGQYLKLFSAIQIYSKPFDIVILQQILLKAKESRDTRALCNVIQAVVHNYDKSIEKKKLFIDAITCLNELENSDWVFRSWFKFEPLIKDLEEKDCNSVLNNLIFVDSVDGHVEDALKIISIKFPEQVIQLFYNRIKYKLENKKDIRYDAVPFRFHELHNTLAPKGNQILPLVLAWFKEDDKLFSWEASRLINNIYPQFDPQLEELLLNKIKLGNKENGDIVMHILDSYKGEIFTHGVCKEFIKKYTDKESHRSMQIFLSKTGVVSGEYGLMYAYERKIEEIQQWKTDKDKEVKSFANAYEKVMKRRILWEKKHADDQIQMMKKTYGG